MQDAGIGGPHPDLREQICEMVNQLDWPEELRPARHARPDDVTVLGQRTWRDVRTINQVLDGGDVSAALLTIDTDGRSNPWFVTAGRKAGADEWGLAACGSCDAGIPGSISGHLRSAWDCCIGFHGSRAGRLNGVHAVEVEYADGTVYRGELGEDDCAIVYAPVDSRDQKDNQAIVWYLNASNGIIYRETYWLGAGLGSPDAGDEG